jgi:ribonuclease BN (tRNA processing enzyme)
MESGPVTGPDGLQLTVLGCSGSYAGAGGACSGYLLRCDDTTIWLDAGSGSLANLQRHVGLHAVDAVVLSHEHPDHWTDLEGFFVACRYVQNRSGVPVYAPKGLRDLMRMGPTEGTFTWQDIRDGGRIEIGPMTLTFSRTDHPPETLAVRVEARGRSLGYSADSGPGWPLAALGPGLHLALCEATFLQDGEGTVPHLSARQAGATARAAGAERLLLTHLWPTIDPEAARAEAASSFAGPVEVAALHQSYPV